MPIILLQLLQLLLHTLDCLVFEVFNLGQDPSLVQHSTLVPNRLGSCILVSSHNPCLDACLTEISDALVDVLLQLILHARYAQDCEVPLDLLIIHVLQLLLDILVLSGIYVLEFPVSESQGPQAILSKCVTVLLNVHEVPLLESRQWEEAGVCTLGEGNDLIFLGVKDHHGLHPSEGRELDVLQDHEHPLCVPSLVVEDYLALTSVLELVVFALLGELEEQLLILRVTVVVVLTFFINEDGDLIAQTETQYEKLDSLLDLI